MGMSRHVACGTTTVPQHRLCWRISLLFSILCVSFAQPNEGSSLVIAEVMSKNQNYPIPIDDSTPDWVEIFNPGTQWVNMAGYVITDKGNMSNGFVFPDGVTIGPGDRKVFLADGSGRLESGTVFLDFKISSGGEKLSLYDSSGNLLSEIEVPELAADQSYGLVAGGDPTSKEGFAILADPSPGAPNSAAAPLKPFNVDVTEVIGPVDGSFDVEIKVTEQREPVKGVQMTYLVNRGDPVTVPMIASGNDVYQATIPAQSPGSMVQWYFTVNTGSGQSVRVPEFSKPTQKEYFGTFVDDSSLDSNLPVIHMNCKDEKAPFTEGKDATPGCSIMLGNGKFYDNVIVRRRGASSLSWPKPKFKVDAGDQGKIFEIYEDDNRAVKEFNMNSEWFEPGENSYMRETLTWKVLKDMGVDALDYYQTQVRLNGDYFGKFSLGEDWDEDPLEESGYSVIGPLMKSISGEFSNLRWDTDPWQAMYYYRPITIESDDAFIQLSDLTKGIAGGICQSRSAYIYDNINLPKVINYMAAMTLLLNQDRCTKNFYVYLDPKTKQWSMLPWDVEAAFATDRGLGGKPAPDYCILDCEQWNSPLYCDKNHPQDLLVTTPWGLITTNIDPDRAARRLMQETTPGFPGMTPGTPINGAAAPGFYLPNTSAIRPDYDADQRNLIQIPQGAKGSYNFLIDAILSIPTTRAMYVRRLRTLMDEYLPTGKLEKMVTDEYNLIKDEAIRDSEFWGSSADVSRGYQQIVAEQIPIRTNQLYGEYSTIGSIPLIPDEQPSSATLEVTSVNPGAQDGYIQLTNPNDIALDISGWTIQGNDFEYTFIPGTVVPANGQVYVAEDPVGLRQTFGAGTDSCSETFVIGGDIKGSITQDDTVDNISINQS